MTDSPISIIMPAYNAAAHIAAVFNRIPVELWKRLRTVWIINDGSLDNTAACMSELAVQYPVIRPVHFDRNRGYGAALKAGLSLCKEEGCSAAVCLHADCQYPPEVICKGVDLMAEKNIDLLQGSRIASGTARAGGMPLYKFAANRMLTFCENKVFGLRLSDFHSGMLFYGRKALDTIPFGRLSNSFDFDVEVIACARARGLAIGEFPIPTYYGTEISHVRSIPYGLRVVNAMRKYLMGRYVQ